MSMSVYPSFWEPIICILSENTRVPLREYTYYSTSREQHVRLLANVHIDEVLFVLIDGAPHVLLGCLALLALSGGHLANPIPSTGGLTYPVHLHCLVGWPPVSKQDYYYYLYIYLFISVPLGLTRGMVWCRKRRSTHLAWGSLTQVLEEEAEE